MATCFGPSDHHTAITQKLNRRYMLCILCSIGSHNTIILKYTYNIKNCITMNSLWLCGIFILVINRRWSETEIKIYCILDLKAIEFFLGTSSALFVVLLLLFLHVIYILGTLAFTFSVSVDIREGECEYSLVSDRSFCYCRWVFEYHYDVHCSFMYHKYICRSLVGNCFMSPFWGS
jgi:hypothetical protein